MGGTIPETNNIKYSASKHAKTIKVHAHFFGTTNIAMKSHTEFMQCMAIEPSELAVTRCAAQAKMALNAGYINVREVGGYGTYLKKLINEGTIPGPTIYPCGKALSQTAGHGDHHSMPLKYVRSYLYNLHSLCIISNIPYVFRFANASNGHNYAMESMNASKAFVKILEWALIALKLWHQVGPQPLLIQLM